MRYVISFALAFSFWYRLVPWVLFPWTILFFLKLLNVPALFFWYVLYLYDFVFCGCWPICFGVYYTCAVFKCPSFAVSFFLWKKTKRIFFLLGTSDAKMCLCVFRHLFFLRLNTYGDVSKKKMKWLLCFSFLN